MRQQRISRLQTVDQSTYGRSEHLSMTAIVTWLVLGFNVGVIAMVALAFGVVPMLVDDFRIQRYNASASVASNERIAMVQVTATKPVTSTSAATMTPRPTSTIAPTIPAATDTPSLAPTEQIVITLQPQVPPTATVTTPPPTVVPPPSSYTLTGITFSKQGWNNCGPANLAMGLSYFDLGITQEDTAAVLKPDREDRNVSPQQMVDFVNEQTPVRAIWRMAGDLDQVRWLIANQFVVIVESGYDPRNGEGWYGHYETVVSYDDDADTITVYDSYLGNQAQPEVTRPFDAFDSDWQSFNRNYIVIYEPAREVELQAFLGGDWLLTSNRRNAVLAAQQDATTDASNGYAWFNLGTSLVAVGQFEEAVAAFRRAFELDLPYRMMWYQFGPYEALLQTGRYSDLHELANTTLRTTRFVEETYYYKGRAFENQGDSAAALEQYRLALDLNPNYTLAKSALQRVES